MNEGYTITKQTRWLCDQCGESFTPSESSIGHFVAADSKMTHEGEDGRMHEIHVVKVQ